MKTPCGIKIPEIDVLREPKEQALLVATISEVQRDYRVDVLSFSLVYVSDLELATRRKLGDYDPYARISSHPTEWLAIHDKLCDCREEKE